MPSTGWMRGLAVANLAALTACTVDPPRVFSPRYQGHPVSQDSAMAPPPRCTSSAQLGTLVTPTLRQATEEGECLMSLFLQASRNQTEIDNANRLALLGITTLGLFRAATKPDSAELIGTSLVGANLYANASTTPSAKRQQIFLAGAETLSCGLGAARLQVIDDTERRAIVDKLSQAVETQKILSGALVQLRMAALPQWDYTAPRRSNSCGGTSAPNCNRLLGDALEYCRKGQEVYRQKCSGQAAVEHEIAAPAALKVLAEQVTLAQTRLASATAEASSLPPMFDEVGPRLWRYTERVQIQVGNELARADPDPKTILALAQGMKPVAATLGGAPALQAGTDPLAAAAPSSNAAAAHSSLGTNAVAPAAARTSTVRTLTLQEGILIDGTMRTLQDADRLTRELRQQSAPLRARLRDARDELKRCSQDSQVAQLQLVPDVDTLSLAPGASQTFHVAGGTGTPQAALSADASTGALSRQLDGSFIFKVSASATPGAVATLRFSDGAQRLSREVQLQVAAATDSPATAATVPVTSLDAKSLGNALGLADAPNDKALRPALEACLRDKLQRNPPDPTALSPADLNFVLKGGCRG